jgi:hypothetical protein
VLKIFYKSQNFYIINFQQILIIKFKTFQNQNFSNDLQNFINSLRITNFNNWKKEIPYFEYIIQIFDTQTILDICNKFKSESKLEITFSSINLNYISRKLKNSPRDFSPIVNRITFQDNYSLFCSVCDKFYETRRQIKEFATSIPEQFFKCFESFIKIFDDQKIYFSLFSLYSLFFIIDRFGISCFIHFLVTHIPITKSLSNSNLLKLFSMKELKLND